MTTPHADPDLVVVGAGPAGLAAATTAAAAGLSVVLLDAGAVAGGQYWRHPAPGTHRTGTALDPERLDGLHHDLPTYRSLVGALTTVDHRFHHHVWAVHRLDDRWIVRAVDRGEGRERAATLRAPRLVLATGAYDRQLPFPGWDLPGVMTAGGVQALLKGHGVAAGTRAVVAGTGPFLLPVATGLARAGVRVLGIHEASSPTRWARELGAVVRAPAMVREGAVYAAALARARVPLHPRSAVVAAHGTDELEAVTVARLDGSGRVRSGSERRVEVDLLAVGWGFTPQLELPLQTGAATQVDVDGSLVCVVDEAQRSTADDVWVAGEACGIGGAALAVVEGRIAGRSAAGQPADPALARERSRRRRFAAALHAAHPVPRDWTSWLTPDTILCRCEEVTVGAVREVVDRDGVRDPRAAKLLTRPGMGWCQGRVCGFATAHLLASWTDTPPELGSLSQRPVASPITFGALIDATVDAVETPPHPHVETPPHPNLGA